MVVAQARVRPLIAIVSQVPLFVEAMAAAFKGIADVQPVTDLDVEASGLVEALRPNGIIVEDGVSIDVIDTRVPCLRVDIEEQSVAVRGELEWLLVEAPLTPIVIRNLLVAQLFGGGLD